MRRHRQGADELMDTKPSKTIDDHVSRSDRLAQIVRIARARKQLMHAKSIHAVKMIRDEAEAIRFVAQSSSLGLDLQNFAAELKLQAEREIGRQLSELKLRGGKRRGDQATDVLSLKELGVDKNQSARWQLEATVPEELFCHYVRAAQASGDEITSAALLRLAKQLRGQRCMDDAELRYESIVRGYSLASHLMGACLPSAPEEGEAVDVDSLAKIVIETKNHSYLLRNTVELLCERVDLGPEQTERRAMSRYLSEIEGHLDSIVQGLRQLALHQRFYESALVLPQGN